jgi:trimeric autotransporter adhesin
MSTKTTFKRIALVTVAALGFGVMSTVAPASAAVAMDTLTVVDGTGSVGDSVTATSASATLTFLPSVASDSVTVVASLVSAPAGNTVFPRLGLAETVNAFVAVDTATAANANPVGTTYAAYTNAVVAPVEASKTTSAKFNVWIGAAATTGVVTAGTYVVRLTPTARPTAGTATFKDITITIAAATQSSSLSTAYINSGATAPTAASDIVAVVAANTAQTAILNRAANIHVTQVRASGTAANESITATITGPGTLGCATALTGAEGTSAGRSLTCKTDGAGVVYVNVYGDGTSGRSTVTITGVTSGHKFATKSILFSSTTIAKLTATAVNPVVSATGTSATDAVSVVATDADGNQIYSPTVYVISSAASVLGNAYSTTGCNWDATDLVTYCDVTPVAAGTANITFTNRASATATTPTTRVDSNAVAIRVGSVTPASAKLSFDKTSYAPGEKATLTLTLLDAAGNAVAGSADNSTFANTWATGGISSDYAFYTGSDTLTATFARVSATTGLQTWTLYMPLQATELTVKAVPGTIFPAAYQAANTATTTTVTAKVSVGNAAGVDAATDAANEATDAANAATDAALAAADAADAATAAAQDASDAVAALSASVSKLISSLRAQITSLTNLVIKIQKKVRA